MAGPDDPDLEALRMAWGGTPPADQAAAYRRMTPHRRRAALPRVRTLQRLATGPRPTRAQQAVEAAELSIGLKQLQALMRVWARPDIDAITPGARARPPGGQNRAGMRVAERVVVKALSRNRLVAEPSVHRRIARLCERIGCATPARMTVRRMLTEARRDIGPHGPSTIENLRDERQPDAGEVLVLAREVLAARTITASGDTDVVEVALLADAVTGYLLAVVPLAALSELGAMAAAEIDHLPPSVRSVWHLPGTIILGSPSLGQRWDEAVRSGAASRKLAVSRETARRTRRWTGALLWRGTEELSPLSRATNRLMASLPLYSPDDLRVALAEVMRNHNHLVDLSVDAHLDQHSRSVDDMTGFAAELVKEMLPRLDPADA